MQSVDRLRLDSVDLVGVVHVEVDPPEFDLVEVDFDEVDLDEVDLVEVDLDENQSPSNLNCDFDENDEISNGTERTSEVVPHPVFLQKV